MSTPALDHTINGNFFGRYSLVPENIYPTKTSFQQVFQHDFTVRTGTPTAQENLQLIVVCFITFMDVIIAVSTLQADINLSGAGSGPGGSLFNSQGIDLHYFLLLDAYGAYC